MVSCCANAKAKVTQPRNLHYSSCNSKKGALVTEVTVRLMTCKQKILSLLKKKKKFMTAGVTTRETGQET